MKNQEIKKSPEFLEYVFELNGDNTLNEALQISLDQINEIDIAQLNRIGHKVYDVDKWTINTILQHLIDWERIWCNHAVVYARGVGSFAKPISQETMANNSNANELTIEQLVKELKILRQSTIMMFNSFNKKILETNCVFSDYQMPLYTIGLTITGHQIHHFNIINERYIPLDK